MLQLRDIIRIYTASKNVLVFSCIYLSCLKSSSWNNLLWTRETPCISGLFSIRKKFIGCGVAESNRFEIQGHKNAQSIDLNTKSSRPLNRLWSKNEFTRDIVQLIILHRVNCEPCPSITTEKEWNTDRRKLSTNRCIGCLNKKKKTSRGERFLTNYRKYDGKSPWLQFKRNM